VGRRKGYNIRLEEKKELNSYASVNDECLRSIFLVEGFPRQCGGGDGTCGGGLPMVGLILFFKHLNLESKVIGGEKESDELMYE
jgi:hypothetical protein